MFIGENSRRRRTAKIAKISLLLTDNALSPFLVSQLQREDTAWKQRHCPIK